MDKHRAKSVSLSAILNFDVSGDSSDDSDFNIEDHYESSNDDDSSIDLDSEYENGGKLTQQNNFGLGDDETSLDSSEDRKNITSKQHFHETEYQKNQCLNNVKLNKPILICCVCLGDHSDANDEIIECNGCGVTVHEHCYGVSDNDSLTSTVSSSATVPWFCEACCAGVSKPVCELCPNFGGIYKETDTGKWVHLVCALYIPGVAFLEIDKLMNVTLFELPYGNWGKWACSLCTDKKFAQTGVCVGCDAGLCRIHFHVTCGQREGLLCETHPDEKDHADPFYAHCFSHSEKFVVNARKRNWLVVEQYMSQRQKQCEAEKLSELPEQLRNKQKLDKCMEKYKIYKANRPPAWVPTQKMARPVTSDANLCRHLWNKAKLSRVDTDALAFNQAKVMLDNINSSNKYINPAFSVEFVVYYLNRNNRIHRLKQQLSLLLEGNSKLSGDLKQMQIKLNHVQQEHTKLNKLLHNLKLTLQKYYEVILKVAPEKDIPDLSKLHGKVNSSVTSSVFSNTNCDPLVVNEGVQCALCKFNTDQHLLAHCDVCHLHYHLGCLDPPLVSMPKKTKFMGWQCSECDKQSSGSEDECVNAGGPRQLRRSNKVMSSLNLNVGLLKDQRNDNIVVAGKEIEVVDLTGNEILAVDKDVKKKEPKVKLKVEGNMKLKRKRDLSPKSVVKPIEFSLKNKNMQSGISTNLTKACVISIPKVLPPLTKKAKHLEELLKCDTCKLESCNTKMVSCDECEKVYHFHCLEPPVKKSPKVRGYSWHCTNCDPSDSDSSNDS